MSTGSAALVAGLFGLVIGSFLNVVVWRLPRRESLAKPPSHCPTCGSGIRAVDNIPVVSWLLLGGRCRSCKTRISPRYPLVEAGTAGIFIAAAFRFGWRFELVDYCLFIAALVAVSAIDLDHHVVPSRIIYPVAGANLALLAAASGFDGSWRSYTDALLGGAIGFGALLLVHLIAPGGMGFGDVRLAGLIGLNVGWLGVAHVAVALLTGFVLGSAVGLALLGVGRVSRRSRVPFAPFLAAGAVVAVLWGTPIVHWWLG